MQDIQIESNIPFYESYIWVYRRAYSLQMVSRILFYISLCTYADTKFGYIS